MTHFDLAFGFSLALDHLAVASISWVSALVSRIVKPHAHHWLYVHF